MANEDLNKKILDLESKLKTLETNYAKHQHDGIDGTNQLRKSIKLDQDQYLQVGLGSQATGPISGLGSASEQLQYAISLGKDDGRTGFVNKADILQMDFLHQPNTATSFISSRRTPVVTALEGTSISTTSGGSTTTIAGFNFETNELAGALINIYNSSGTFVESRVIASNTATVITITGTWSASTSSATFDIYLPVYLGTAEFIWQRFYTQEGTAGGIRFGVGPTAGGQNGLLYSDAIGDLYWRDKNGDSLKLNNAPTP
jgi:hypothetical protein